MKAVFDIRDQAFKTGRQVYLAGLGVAATAGEETKKVFDKLVDKGTHLSARETQIKKVGTSLGGRVKDLSGKVTDKVQVGVTGTLSRLGIPSRKEILDLTTSVEALTKKVEAIQAQKA